MWWHTLFGVLAGLLLTYLFLLALLWRYARAHPEAVSMRAALRLLPDLLRLVRWLAAETTLPPGVRVRLVLLLAYLASPIDVVPGLHPRPGLRRRRHRRRARPALGDPVRRTRRAGPALAGHTGGPTPGGQLAGLPTGA
jgi:hypothetical protein